MSNDMRFFLKTAEKIFDIKKYRFTEKNRNSIKDLKKIIKKFKKYANKDNKHL